MQRAVFIAVLSFLFFLAMMFAFYLRQDIGYFLLASVFLVIYLLMMFSWVMKRRSVVEIYENGLKYSRHTLRWDEISAVSDDGTIDTADRDKTFSLPKSLNNLQDVVRLIRAKIS